MDTLGERVKVERGKLGLTQQQLAEKVTRLGFTIGQAGIAQIERRGHGAPKCIVELAGALQLAPKWLQTGRGDKHPKTTTAVVDPEIPVRSTVGAGDIVHPLDDDGPIDYTPAPPDMEGAEATLVRGKSMEPLYHDGDLLFHRRITVDLSRLRGEIVVAQVMNGPRYVKVLQPGRKKGTFNLASINKASRLLTDRTLEWAAPIVWVKKRQRF